MRATIWLLLGLIVFVGCSKSDAPSPTARPYTEEEKAYLAGAQALDRKAAARDAVAREASCTRTINVNGLVDRGVHALDYLGGNGQPSEGTQYDVHACSDAEALAIGKEKARLWAASEGAKLIQPHVQVVSPEVKKFWQDTLRDEERYGDCLQEIARTHDYTRKCTR